MTFFIDDKEKTVKASHNKDPIKGEGGGAWHLPHNDAIESGQAFS